MEKIKKNWKVLLIILLLFMFVTNCIGKGNYQRKYKGATQKCEMIMDSMSTVNGVLCDRIDSLNHVIDLLRLKNESLTTQNDDYRRSSNRPINVTINSDSISFKKKLQ